MGKPHCQQGRASARTSGVRTMARINSRVDVENAMTRTSCANGKTQEIVMLQDAPLYAYIPARDVTRARRFYEGQLGFNPKQEVAGGVVYEFAGKTACFLYHTPNAGTSQASQAFWQVDDVDREIAELKKRGVAFEHYDDLPGERTPGGALVAGGAKAAWFKDSEGNILALIEGA
jgi:predicted enzyme related to lactoylglutathione lyase